MNSSKKIIVIGAGAIGKALAAFLATAGREVLLLRASTSDAPSGTEKINVRVDGKETLTTNVRVGVLEGPDSLDGIIVLTSKSYGNSGVAKKLKSRIGNSPIIILQNGLSVENVFLDILTTNVYRCVLFATSQFNGTTVNFKPVSNSLVGTMRGKENELEEIVQLLNSTHFPFKIEKDIQRVAWKKSIINCVFNSVCPLLEADNGIFHRNTEALQLARTIVEQCVKVAQLKNIQLTTEETIESLIMISKFSDGQLISTYQDILNGRETEIDTLNLTIASIAEQHGKSDLVRETKLLGELTRLKASIFRK